MSGALEALRYSLLPDWTSTSPPCSAPPLIAQPPCPPRAPMPVAPARPTHLLSTPLLLGLSARRRHSLSNWPVQSHASSSPNRRFSTAGGHRRHQHNTQGRRRSFLKPSSTHDAPCGFFCPCGCLSLPKLGLVRDRDSFSSSAALWPRPLVQHQFPKN